MKKNILTGGIIVTILFSGCVSKFSKTKVGDTVVSAAHYEDHISFDSIGEKPKSNDAIRMQLYTASKLTLDENKKYFVITNDGASNLEGFPINTYSELVRYMNLAKNNKKFTTTGGNMGIGKQPLRNSFGTVTIKFVPVGDEYENSFISVWDAKKTLEDTK
jgi:hypothetical protein